MPFLTSQDIVHRVGSFSDAVLTLCRSDNLVEQHFHALPTLPPELVWFEVTWFEVKGDEMLFRSFTFVGAICLTVSGLTCLESQSCNGQVREVRRVLMSDIGHARIDRRGNPVVTINQRMCRQLGPELCSFFRNHEYGHIQLRHFHRDISVQQAEAEADCFAAKISSPQAVRAAQKYFAGGRGGTRLHGTSGQRASRVASCGMRNRR